MAKNAYPIITDMHTTYKDKRTRVDYQKEILSMFQRIEEIIDKYDKEGYNVMPIFLGDIVDISYKDIMKAIELNNIFVALSEKCYKVYSVVGNHETSFYRNNPFWSLFSHMESEKVKQIIKRSWTPRGVLDLITVTDEVVDGEVSFYFNHYMTPVSIPNNKVNIGLFHQDIVSNEIINEMQYKYDEKYYGGKYVDLGKNEEVIKGYDYCFFGHLHKVYGEWVWHNDLTDKDTVLYYLATLGRPNHTEVNDKDRERNIPVVIVEDGKLVGVKDNKFKLEERRLVVREDVISKQQEVRKVVKKNKEMVNYRANTDNPVDNIKRALFEDPKLFDIFNEYLTDNETDYDKELEETYDDFMSVIFK